MSTRQCGGCTLCCRLLPIKEFGKAAGERCQHQRTGKGCAVYQQAAFPLSCRFWSCRWRTNDETAELRRPDRSHYVIDMLPDFITMIDNATGERTNVEVIQIWCDPKYPDAWQDPALLDYLAQRGEEGKAALVRWNNRDGVTVFPPAMSADGQFHTKHGGLCEREHSFEEKLAGIASAKKIKIGP